MSTTTTRPTWAGPSFRANPNLGATIVAVTVASVVPMLFPNVAGAISTAAMVRLPLVLIPGFFVPGYLILHLIALAQARRAASALPWR